ncbi:poly [ADP-ribose] polymerase tankyrase-2-like isoform X2 [Branchiostoma floridae]|uniref:Poly [ADP-ribose] polymerase tankyrase-2-like isoform X2 n=1 Tax=Branchiostoma floridae TaxID=7739 RepID=A0A9J7LFP2_BRAFL|nr:poly [ADP-ribose] polymerase tankyrase-2-like isoform X2 [Branchiostoma floridae]
MAESANEALLEAAGLHGNSSLEDVKAALKAGADVDFEHPDPDVPSMGNGTALYIACILGDVDIVRLLLRKGASIMTRTVGGLTPLHAAAFKGQTEVVDLLVQHGATIDIRDGFQDTPLILACNNKHVDTVRRLIELGARPDLIDGGIGRNLGIAVGNPTSDESIKLIQEAMETKLLRCCNPKCGKPGYRKTLKLCAGCKLTRYCSRDCQKQHWSVGHKKCCGHDAYTGGREQADSFTHMAYEKVNFTVPTHILEDIQQNFMRL